MRKFEKENLKRTIERQALQEQVTPREICLRNIETWQHLLRVFTQDGFELTQEQWEEQIERELDDRRRTGGRP